MTQSPQPSEPTQEQELRDILSKLSADVGEEYHKLHSGKQDFDLSNSRMSYYENEAIEKIQKLFAPGKPEIRYVTDNLVPGYTRGYNSGYVAGKRHTAQQVAEAGKRARYWAYDYACNEVRDNGAQRGVANIRHEQRKINATFTPTKQDSGKGE